MPTLTSTASGTGAPSADNQRSDRLPRPARYATFDRRQIPAAAALGFDVVAPVER